MVERSVDILNVIANAGEKKGNHINGCFFIHVDMLHKRSTKENCRCFSLPLKRARQADKGNVPHGARSR